jgi:hypothetical protein
MLLASRQTVKAMRWRAAKVSLILHEQATLARALDKSWPTHDFLESVHD